MAILRIIKFGNPILTRVAAPVQNIDEEIIRLAEDMVHTMHAAPGVGLAAPQVGICKRLITLDLSGGEQKGELIILVNPEIIISEGEIVEEEGCLSVPDIQEKVGRPARVVVKGLDLKGTETTIDAQGLLARVFSHELDHLNGRLFIEHLSPLKKALVKKKLKKKVEAGQQP